MWFVIYIIFLSIATYQVRSLLKKKNYKDALLHTLIFLVGIAWMASEHLDLPVPNPLDGITLMYEPIRMLFESD